MRILRVLIAAWLLIPVPLLSKEYSVKSPDGKINLSIETATGMTVTVKYENREIISGLSPELQLEGVTIPGPKTAVTKTLTSSVSDVIIPVVPHKNSRVPDIYNGLTLRLRGGSSVEFRVYNDGVAYRFTTAMKGNVTVKSERFGFALPAGTSALWPSEKGFMSHNECTFYQASMDTVGPKHLASLPALFTTGGVNILLGEADIQDYPGLWINGDGRTPGIPRGREGQQRPQRLCD